jgi:IMP dehydrogenase
MTSGIRVVSPNDWGLSTEKESILTEAKEALSYNDVLLAPQYSDIESRSEVNINSELDDHITLFLPVISSPMDTITEGKMVKEMSKAGGIGIVHRYNSILQQTRIVEEAVIDLVDYPAAAIGVTGDYLERAKSLVAAGSRILCIDVAHGHHILMKKAIKNLRDTFNESVHIMAGNVATLEAFDALSEWGADSIRVGIGGGSICSTRLVSGHGIPTLQSIVECAKSHYDTKIIADGGARTSGDIVKALAAGADFVMAGSILAGTKETPGNIFTSQDGKKYKVYRGMASASAQKDWRGRSSAPEGISTTVPYRGGVKAILRDLCGGIRSGLSYSGARNLKELRAKAKFIKQSSASQVESSTHILRK